MTAHGSGPEGSASPHIHVLHVMRPAAGGMRRHLIELIRHSDPATVMHSVAGPQDFLDSLPDDLPCAVRHPLAIAAKPHIVRDLLAARRLAGLVTSDIDVVHAHGLRAAWMAAWACRMRPFPLVVTAHNLPPSSRMTRIAVGVIAGAARRWIAVSQPVADGLIRYGAPPDRITAVPNGVDIDSLQAEVHWTQCPFAAGIDDEFVVGCIARLSPEKGVDVLLDAMSGLPNLLVVAGDGPCRAELEHKGGAHFLGRIDDVRPLLQFADVIAIPSRSEGQGIVALEAMAAGTPVVASRVGGLAEMLTDGETALLVPPNDPQALSEAIKRLRDDGALRERLAENGLRLVRERYDVRHAVERVIEVYRGSVQR